MNTIHLSFNNNNYKLKIKEFLNLIIKSKFILKNEFLIFQIIASIIKKIIITYPLTKRESLAIYNEEI